jgi:hypothetical protein
MPFILCFIKVSVLYTANLFRFTSFMDFGAIVLAFYKQEPNTVQAGPDPVYRQWGGVYSVQSDTKS